MPWFNRGTCTGNGHGSGKRLMAAGVSLALTLAVLSVALYWGQSPVAGSGRDAHQALSEAGPCHLELPSCSGQPSFVAAWRATDVYLTPAPDAEPRQLVFLTHRSSRTGIQLGDLTVSIILVVVIASLGVAFFGAIVFFVHRLMDEEDATAGEQLPERPSDGPDNQG